MGSVVRLGHFHSEESMVKFEGAGGLAKELRESGRAGVSGTDTT